MYNTRKLTSFHKKKELLHLVSLDLNPPFKHAGLVSVRPGKLNKTLINGKSPHARCNLVHIQFSDSGVPSNALSTADACCTFSGISNSGIFIVTTPPGEGLIGTTQYCRQLMVCPGYL